MENIATGKNISAPRTERGLSKQRGEMPIGQVLIIAFVTIPLVIALVVFSEGAINYLAEAVEKFMAP